MKVALVTITLLFVSFVFCDTLVFTATLQGNQEVPPVATTGEGSGEFEYDTSSKELSYEISFDFLQSGIAVSHLHGPGAVGTNANVITELRVPTGETEGEYKGTVTLTAQQEEYLKSGLLYINVHTENIPTGEIRGQILRNANKFKAELEPSQMVPPVTNSKAKGSASVSLDHETLQMKYSISHSVKDATAIHFHGPARAGNNAGPLITLQDISDDFDGKVELTLEQAVYLRSELLYLAIHSDAHPDGEIRGQVLVDDGASVGKVALGLLGLLGIVVVVAIIVALVVGAVVLLKEKAPAIKEYIDKKRGGYKLDQPGVSNEPFLSNNDRY